ncbi:MAG: sodium-dependent transporter [Kiritimatiellae bacterium]|nr:sodium-dependent transporter [Kiritimatiellia bacterium]
MSEMREKLASRLGFILLSAGCAIGLGNVWRFPYITGQNGGGWFVLVYLVFLALIGLPVLVMEFAMGRASQRSIAKIHAALTPGKKAWRVHGVAGAVGSVILMMFYTTVTGWMAIYLCKTAAGSFAGLGPDEIGAAFGGMVGDPWIQAWAMLGVVLTAVTVCGIGLQNGLERVTKWMMLCLLVLIVVLAGHSVLLDGAGKGLSFYLVPDFARMKAVGVGKVMVEAMNHAFFTLSIGIGAMAIFGSYVGRDHTLLKEGLNVAALDTFVAIVAGLVIIPACFAYGVEPGQGPGLIFVTLPNVFNHMAGGRVWGTLFFLFMCAAALTTVLAVFECILASMRDFTGWSRGRACLVLAVAIPVLSLPCILGFNVWSAFRPFGPGSCVLDLEDFVVSNVLLPLGGLAFALYCCHRYGWGWEKFRAEANTGAGPRIPGGVVRVYCAYVLPALVFALFAIGIFDKFRGSR